MFLLTMTVGSAPPVMEKSAIGPVELVMVSDPSVDVAWWMRVGSSRSTIGPFGLVTVSEVDVISVRVPTPAPP